MSNKLNWEIIDDTGVIHSGTEEEMKIAFDVMREPDIELIRNQTGWNRYKAEKLIEKYLTSWTGDLKLIEVHQITR
jgi:hypothetical protein